MLAFSTSELLVSHKKTGNKYLEFIRRESMSLGIYKLAAGEQDPQRPHDEDEVYYVIEGRAMIHVAGEERKVEAGDLIFVAAEEAHYFHEIVKDLTLLVFFAPAESD